MQLALKRRRAGFSLIELVVVLTILASLAGLTVGILGWLRGSADKATAAHTMGSLLNNIEIYHTTVGVYPNQLDSLLDSTGTKLYDGNSTTDTGLHDELRGATPKLKFIPLDDNLFSSLNKAGITMVMNHTPGVDLASLPGNTGTINKPLASGVNVASINLASTGGLGIVDALYPPQNGGPSGSGLLATNVTLVVFGFGPANTAVGKTVVSPPSYAGVGDVSRTYNRFILVFAVTNDGSKAAQLKAIIDSKGDHLNEELTEFYQNKPQ
jgi:prepilin-type N-terminal cleavage/methylation domain-containing protein